MRVQTCIVAAVILVIRQIDVNVTIEQLQRFHLLISAGIVYNRKRKPLFSGNLQRFDNLRHIMGAGNKVDVMRTFFLQREKGFRQCIYRNVLSLGLSAADLAVLAEHTAERAMREKHRARAICTRNRRLLPHMKRCACSFDFDACTAGSAALCTVCAAGARTQLTVLKHIGQNNPSDTVYYIVFLAGNKVGKCDIINTTALERIEFSRGSKSCLLLNRNTSRNIGDAI